MIKPLTKAQADKLQMMMGTLHTLVLDNTGKPEYKDTVAKMKLDGLHVYHVIESDYVLGYSETVHMISYCYISQMDDLKNISGFFQEFKAGYCYANVFNTSWGIDELGGISFKIIGNKMARQG